MLVPIVIFPIHSQTQLNTMKKGVAPLAGATPIS